MMRRFLVICLAVSCGVWAVGCHVSGPRDLDRKAANAVPETFVEGNNQFAFDLYAKMADSPGNLFFSPHSISTALAMTYAGARGTTHDQMQQVLHFPEDDASVHAGFSTLLRQLGEANMLKKCTLHSANRLWAQQGYPFSKAFLKLTDDSYGAEAASVDFAGNTTDAIAAINKWVTKATKNRIRDLVSPDSINGLTRLVLTNAVYFKADWKCPFRPSFTEEEPFYTTSDATVPVPFMHQGRAFRYAETEALQVLELPYFGRISMVVVLPKQIDGLGDLEERLALDAYEELLSAMRDQEVVLSLPRFQMEHDIDLGTTLVAMGMADAFAQGAADFSGMVEVSSGKARELFLSAVLHKAYVDVNEEGTEAAAATSGLVAPTAINLSPSVEFRADHPFLFLIRDTRSGSILFMGRFAGPAS